MYWMRVTLSGHASAGRVLWDRHIAAELEREWPLLFHSMLSSKNNLRNVPSIDILRVMWQWYYHYYTPFSRQILCSSCPKELWKHCHCHILCPPVKMFQNMIKMKLKKTKRSVACFNHKSSGHHWATPHLDPNQNYFRNSPNHLRYEKVIDYTLVFTEHS